MCKYCEEIESKCAIWFTRQGPFYSKEEKKEKVLGAIFDIKSNCGLLNEGPVLCIQGKDKENPTDWFDFRINYCPRCGRQLREELIPEYKSRRR